MLKLEIVEERMARATSKRAAKKTTRKKTTRKRAPARKKRAPSATAGRRKKTTSVGTKSTAGRKKAGVVRKTTLKKTAAKKSSRKYGPKASSEVGQELHELKRGKLRSGGSGKKVTDRKQAIAIGLSKARRSGAKVPPKSGGRKK